jgi:anti-anti-sigma factor
MRGDVVSVSNGFKLPPRLEMQDLAHEGTHTLMLRGDLDIVSGSALERLAGHVCQSGAACLVVDLSNLDFIDSTGVKAIMVIGRLCEAHGQEFRLIPGPKNVQRIFEVSGLAEELPFRAT